MNAANREAVAVDDDFIVVYRGNSIEIYDENCKRIAVIPRNNREVMCASAGTFTVRRDRTIEVFDMFGKRISTRSV